MEAKLQNYRMKQSISMKTEHCTHSSGTIDCEGHELHNKTFCKETVTPRSGGETVQYSVGEPIVCYFIDGVGTPDFETIQEFEKHYNIKFERE